MPWRTDLSSPITRKQLEVKPIAVLSPTYMRKVAITFEPATNLGVLCDWCKTGRSPSQSADNQVSDKLATHQSQGVLGGVGRSCLWFLSQDSDAAKSEIKLRACLKVTLSHPKPFPANTKHLYSFCTTSVQHCTNVIQIFRVYWVASRLWVGMIHWKWCEAKYSICDKYYFVQIINKFTLLRFSFSDFCFNVNCFASCMTLSPYPKISKWQSKFSRRFLRRLDDWCFFNVGTASYIVYRH